MCLGIHDYGGRADEPAIYSALLMESNAAVLIDDVVRRSWSWSGHGQRGVPMPCGSADALWQYSTAEDRAFAP